MITFLEFVNMLPRKHKMIKVLSKNNDEVLISRGPDEHVYFTHDEQTVKMYGPKVKDRESIRKGEEFLKSINNGKKGQKINRGSVINRLQSGPTKGGYFK